MSDMILFVKETKTCHYTLVIHTPRLCGLPGFRSAAARQHEQANIRCREVVATLADANKALPEADYPIKIPQRQKPVLPPPPPAAAKAADDEKVPGYIGGLNKEALRKAFVALTGKEPREGELATAIVLEEKDDGNFIMKMIEGEGDDAFYEDDYEYAQGEREPAADRQAGVQDDQLARILKAAGFDILDVTSKLNQKNRKEEKTKKKAAAQSTEDEDDDEVPHVRDSL